jgi:hypothetical protein
VARSTEILPWKVRVYSGRRVEADDGREIRQAIVDSIHRGVPVQYGREEDGIIVGYQNGGAEWLCFHPERDDGRTMVVEPVLGWGVAVFTSRKETLPETGPLALAALRQAVRMAGARQAGGYLVGFEAWEQYIARLERLETADRRPGNDVWLGNAWIYACLAEHRRCAAGYLRDVAGGLPTAAAEPVGRAAGLYEAISAEILTDHGSAFCGLWTGEARPEQVRRLRDALPLERQAIAALGQAIELAG